MIHMKTSDKGKRLERLESKLHLKEKGKEGK